MALYILAGIGLVAIALGWIIVADMMRHAARRTEEEAARLLAEDEAHEREQMARRLRPMPPGAVRID